MAPGDTKPTGVYFFRGLWGWYTDQWLKLTSDVLGRLRIAIAAQEIDVEVKQQAPADLTVGAHGYDGAAWQKLSLLWGYTGTYGEVQSAVDVAAGNAYVAFAAVPAGEVWVVTSFCLAPKQANATYIALYATINSVSVELERESTVVADTALSLKGHIVLAEGDLLRFYYQAAALNDDFYAAAAGYKMEIA